MLLHIVYSAFVWTMKAKVISDAQRTSLIIIHHAAAVGFAGGAQSTKPTDWWGKIHVNFELFRGMNLSSQTGACIDLNKLDIQDRKEVLNASNSFRQFQPMNLSAIESQLNLCDWVYGKNARMSRLFSPSPRLFCRRNCQRSKLWGIGCTNRRASLPPTWTPDQYERSMQVRREI